MDVFFICFSVICFLLAILAGFILSFVNKEQVFSNRLLGLFLFLLGLQNLIVFLVYTRFMLKIPHIYRVFGPTTLLIMPIGYFYVRSVLRRESRFRKYDWLILIPAILYAINLMPVYLMPSDEKLALVQNYLRNPKLQAKFNEGLFPPYVFPLVRVIWSTVFFVKLFNMVRQFKARVDARILQMNKDLLQWLTVFSYIMLVFVSVHLVFTIVAPIFRLDATLVDLVLQLIVFVTASMLFAKPKILYGLYIPSGQQEQSASDQIKSDDENPVVSHDSKPSHLKPMPNSSKYKVSLESHFKSNAPFLNPNYSLDDLVREINIPKHVLSSFINQEYGMGFRKFLNSRRVAYILENYQQPKWKNLTFEAIANESGFKNRSTFILNFKEVTKKTPMEYFKELA